MKVTGLSWVLLCGSLVGFQASPVSFAQDDKPEPTDQFHTAMEYMRRVYGSITEKDGSPIDLATTPTTVWCLFDRGVLAGKSIASNNKEPQNQETMLSFNFPSKTNSSDVMLERATLRVYLELTKGLESNPVVSPVAVNTSVSARRTNGEIISILETMTLTMTPGSSRWIELDISRGLGRMWSEVVTAARLDLSVAIANNGTALRVACPGGVPPTDPSFQLQPHLVLHLGDNALRRSLVELGALSPSEPVKRRLQRASDVYPNACRLRNFTIWFSRVGLTNIEFPTSYNAGKCVGSCAEPYFKAVDDVSNYAILVNSAKANVPSGPVPDEIVPPPNAPCCVPTRYLPLMVLTRSAEGLIRLETLADMQVTRCGCR